MPTAKKFKKDLNNGVIQQSMQLDEQAECSNAYENLMRMFCDD